MVALPLLSWKILPGPAAHPGVVLEFTGAISEIFDATGAFKELESRVPKGSGPIWIDLGKLTRMNSAGCRRWMLFVFRMQAAYPTRFLELSEVLMDLVLIAPQVLGNPQLPIHSIQVPYFCASCSNRFTIRTEVAALDATQLPTPWPACPKCKNVTALDALEKEFLSFIRLCKKSAVS